MKARKGLLLLWVEIAAALLLLLAGSALSLMGMAARALSRGQEAADMTLLAEEAIETMKYNERFGRTLSLPSSEERNGRTYTVTALREQTTAGGLPFAAASVTVTAPGGETLSLTTLLGPVREAEEETEPGDETIPAGDNPPEGAP